MTAADVIAQIEALAPPDAAQEWDNVGLQVGSPEAAVGTVLVCLEVTAEVVDEALQVGAELIVAHHPLIFRPMPAVRTDLPLGALIERLLGEGIAVYAAHTNLDAAPEVGTAATLAELLELTDATPLLEEDGVALGLVGELAGEMSVCELAEAVRELLGPGRMTVVGEDAPVRWVAVMPGSGGDAVAAAAAAADVLVCGDLTHHDALDALAVGLAVIDAGHYATERPVVGRLAKALQDRLGSEVTVVESAVVTDPFAGEPC
ncbi:MAG: Nif3-like dinuclear metal center hexameric protein [Armatimonadota bacterium]|nr:Nif3-like dinuclear metal center hexameric protein [Armatimonadota bacterium]